MTEPRGVIFQHGQLESDIVSGQRVRSIVGVDFDGDGAKERVWALDVLQLRLDGPHWHRVFLDAGALFWDESEEQVILDEREDADCRELGAELGVVGRECRLVLAFGSDADAATAVHLHLDDGRKIVFGPSEPEHLDSPGRLDVRRGSVEDTYLELLKAHDVPSHYEAPPDLAHGHLAKRVAGFREALEGRLGRALEVDDQVQDASFHADVIIDEQQTGSFVHQRVVRFSNFGSMATVTDPHANERELVAIRDVLRHHDFIYVPRNLLEAAYDGEGCDPQVIDSWWTRYFDYI
ncbi:MAG: hypothetical protein OEZ06_16270 [Myxococcales bacterium]|nr:hypothetical protein [Myxococcales bacterium]